MIVSWNWLKQYVALDTPPGELEQRLMMAGLNHEETTAVGDDLAINLEVTSNRPDCLGHLGVAREAAVLFGQELQLPSADPVEGKTPIEELAQVSVQCPEHCPRYTARVIRGVKIGSSPAWLVDRLHTLGIASVNNVVDITNYVLMECGQPLHAFDLAKLRGQRIIVRAAAAQEPFEAINHKTYELQPSMCVIADAERPVALAGVMGGADTEVTPRTTELLIESAQFTSLSIRNTARALNLHSDSSYRFERPLDPQGVDWASRRACQLILELAGGELAKGVIDVGSRPVASQPVVLRFDQLKRILGIEIQPAVARKILIALGNREVRADARQVEVVPPSWRRDLSREIDLVEEVARIHGYDKIPEDVSVPMATSHRSRADRVLEKVCGALTACGFDEAMTLSVVEEPLSEALSPWTDMPPLRCNMPVLRRADRLRRSLVPSLLAARRTNETLSNEVIELFEIAKVYLPSQELGALPVEELLLGVTSGGGFFTLKGVLEAVVAAVNPAAKLEAHAAQLPLLERGQCCRLTLALPGAAPQMLGFLGTVSGAGLKQFELRGGSAVCEVKLSALMAVANLIPQHAKLPAYPAVARDLNLVVDEAVRWADVEATVRQAWAPYGEELILADVYRDADRLGSGKKSLLMTLTLRSHEATLKNEEADRIRDQIVARCRERHGAALRA